MAGPAMSGMPSQSARCGVTIILAVVASIAWAGAAMAQSPQPTPAVPEPSAQPVPSAQPAPQVEAPAAAPASPPAQPWFAPAPAQPDETSRKPDGFFDAFNRWVDKSAKDFKASVEESNAKWREFGEKSEKAAKDAAAAQKEAAEAFKNLSNARVVEGRQTCVPAPNGSPDCQAAAEVICRGKGFGKGQSADIQTTRKCPAKSILARNDEGCRTETVVVKAACQ